MKLHFESDKPLANGLILSDDERIAHVVKFNEMTIAMLNYYCDGTPIEITREMFANDIIDLETSIKVILQAKNNKFEFIGNGTMNKQLSYIFRIRELTKPK